MLNSPLAIDGDDGDDAAELENSEDDDLFERQLDACGDVVDEKLAERPSKRPRLSHGQQRLSDFPDDCILTLMGFVRDLGLVHLSETCWRFRALSVLLWRSLYASQWGSLFEWNRLSTEQSERTNNLDPLIISNESDRDNMIWKDRYRRRYMVERNWKQAKYSVRSLFGHMGSVCSIDLDGNNMISSGQDHLIKLWDLRSLKPLCRFEGHEGPVWGVKLDMAAHKFVSCSSDGFIRLWNLLTGECEHMLHVSPKEVWSVDLDANRVIAGCQGRVRVYDRERLEQTAMLDAHDGSVFAVRLCEPTTFVSCSSDKTLKLWDTRLPDSLVRIFQGHTQPVFSFDVCTSSGILISGSGDKTICEWDLGGAGRIETYKGHTDSVWSIQFQGRRLISAGVDTTIRVWDRGKAATEAQLYTLECHLDPVFCCRFDATKLVSGGTDGSVLLWDFLNLGNNEYESLMNYRVCW